MISIFGLIISIFTFYPTPVDSIDIQGEYEWRLSQYEGDGRSEMQFYESMGKLRTCLKI